MSKPVQSRIGIADGFSRGFDILRLGFEIHTRAMMGLGRMCLVIGAMGAVLWCLYAVPLAVIFGAAASRSPGGSGVLRASFSARLERAGTPDTR